MPIRVMTYNVHACVGSDRRRKPERTARVIEAVQPDIVALQEVDVGRTRSAGSDQPSWLAARLGMQSDFCSARECDGGRYGIAVLSRHPLTQVRHGCLPRVWKRSEERAVQWVTIETPAGTLDVFNTHLALTPRERLVQAEEIGGTNWLCDPRCRPHTVLCGDFNTLPGSNVVRRLSTTLSVAGHTAVGAMPRTYPALLPLVRLDYVLVGAGLRVSACRVHTSLLTRLASDHLPVVVDLDFEDSASADERSRSAARGAPSRAPFEGAPD